MSEPPNQRSMGGRGVLSPMDVAEAQADHYQAGEVLARLQNLSNTEVAQIKLMSERLATHGMQPEDLRQEAFRRMIDEEKPRRWPRNIPFGAFMHQTMRSIAWANRKARSTRFELNEADADVGLAERPEAVVASHEVHAEAQDEARRIRQDVLSLFDDDQVAALVVEGKMADMQGQELCELAGITTSELATVNTRILRRIKGAYPKGWNRDG